MAIGNTSPRTRRAILLGALGGAVASVAATIGRASPSSATNGEAVLIGHTYTATVSTEIDATGISYGFIATNDSGTGFFGQSASNTGVEGRGATGVFGNGTSVGVLGMSSVETTSGTAAGVEGYSGGYPPPAAPAKTGVYGYAAQDASARGVTGETTAGRAVNGIATTGTGVFGKATDGEGVRGVSTSSNGTAGSSASGIASGVYGENTGGGFGAYGRSNVGSAGSGVFGESTAGTGVSAATTTGVALRATSTGSGLAITAQGRVAFSTSGLASVAVGSATKTIKPGSDLVTGSLVLCTLESGQPHLAIQRVTKNPSANSFTVYLSAAVAAGNTAKVGWFVIG